MAARISKNSAAGADWQCLQKGALMLSPLRCCGRLLTLSVCQSGNSQAQIKKGIDVIAALGVFLSIQIVYFGQGISDAPQKGLSEARLPVNVYVIEYAAKLITTNLTTKFFNENFVKKIPTF